jgi:ribosomal protein L30E
MVLTSMKSATLSSLTASFAKLAWLPSFSVYTATVVHPSSLAERNMRIATMVVLDQSGCQRLVQPRQPRKQLERQLTLASVGHQ